MTDLVITAANVIAGSDAEIDHKLAGEAITAGQAMYVDPTSKKFMKADSNAATEVARKVTHMALNNAAANQPLAGQKPGGHINPGATLTANTSYFLSDTPGGICPLADVGSGEYMCLVGIAESASSLKLLFTYTGAAN